MRNVLLALLILACLAIIVLPALFPVPSLGGIVQPSARETRIGPLGRSPVWIRWSPFGAHLGGWQGVVSAAASWVYLYLTSVLVLALVPHRARLVTDTIRSGPWSNRLRLFAIGLLAMIASALLVLLARFAFVWFALVVVLAGAVFVLTYLGVVCVSLAIGGLVRQWARLAVSPWIEVALGSLILFALGRIPVLGWLGIGIASALGFGAVLATHLGSGRSWSLREWETAD